MALSMTGPAAWAAVTPRRKTCWLAVPLPLSRSQDVSKPTSTPSMALSPIVWFAPARKPPVSAWKLGTPALRTGGEERTGRLGPCAVTARRDIAGDCVLRRRAGGVGDVEGVLRIHGEHRVLAAEQRLVSRANDDRGRRWRWGRRSDPSSARRGKVQDCIVAVIGDGACEARGRGARLDHMRELAGQAIAPP